jgi:hypothetical protein
MGTNMDYEKIKVEFYSGYKVIVRPMFFERQGQRLEVEEIVDRWYEGGVDPSRPVMTYFKVKTADGQLFVLRYVSALDAWFIRV